MEKDKRTKKYLIIGLILLTCISISTLLFFRERKNNNDQTSVLVTVEEYRSYIQTLDNSKIESVSAAKNKLLNVAENQVLSAEFLNEFEQFVNKVGLNLKVEEVIEEDLNASGFILEHNEGETTIELSYQYLYNTFKNKAAKIKTDYYNVKNTIYKYANSNHLYKDAALMVSWNECREILILFDNYFKKYSETTEQQEEFNLLFEVYIGNSIVDNTPIYDDNNKLKAEVRESYEYLLENNKDFSKYEIVKEFYEKHK